MYLLDTNVVSETIKRKPNPQVKQWFAVTADSGLYISAITIGELRKGIAKAIDESRKIKLHHWLETQLKPWFGHRILPVDVCISERWGEVTGTVDQALPAIDSLLAATALHHNLVMVTRNTDDFRIPHLRLLNPWEL